MDMEKDKLKNFIDDYKSEFDAEFPSDKVWKGIEESKKKKKPFVWLWSAAASVAIGLGIGFWQINKSPEKIIDQSFEITATKTDTTIIKDTLIQLAPNEIVVTIDTTKFKTSKLKVKEQVLDFEGYYTAQINQKYKEVKQYPDSKIFLEEVDKLKNEYQILKKEMKIGANREMVLEAMIGNYQLRLQLLEDLLKELKEENNQLENETI
jgi:hypothetical protein